MILAQLPNAITLFRIGCVVPVAVLIGSQHYAWALLWFLVAGVSDGLDGYLAKRFGWGSRFGAIADPLADKLLLVLSYGVLTWQGHIPFWLFILVMARDVVIVFGGVIVHLLWGAYGVVPSRLSKLNTLLQIILVLCVLWHLGLHALPEELLPVLYVVVASTTIASGVHYAWRTIVNISKRSKRCSDG